MFKERLEDHDILIRLTGNGFYVMSEECDASGQRCLDDCVIEARDESVFESSLAFRELLLVLYERLGLGTQVLACVNFDDEEDDE